jgi:hypothetical protein
MSGRRIDVRSRLRVLNEAEPPPRIASFAWNFPWEIAMRLITLLTVVTFAASSAALAQNAGSGNGDSPQNKGSTGWTGAHPETGGATPQAQDVQNTGQIPAASKPVEVHDDAEAKDQPVMATGEDLNGPGEQFPPSKTPE